MSIPTPSFFKIRLVTIVIIFLVFCFLVGFVKNVFANPYTEAKCRNVIYSYSPVFIEYGSETWEVLSDGSFETNSSDQNHKEGYLVHLKSVYSNGSGWRLYLSTAVYVFNLGEGKNISLADLDPCIDCSNKAEELTEQCGGMEGQSWEWTDKEQCQGECKAPCPENGSPATGYYRLYGEITNPFCYDGCYIKSLKNGGVGLFTYEIINGVRVRKYFLSGDSEQLIYTGESCVPNNVIDPFDPDSPDESCSEKEISCTKACNGLVENFECNENGESICKCKEVVKEDEQFVPVEDGKEKDEIEKEDAPQEDQSAPDAPENTNNPSDADLKSIKKNLDTLISQGNELKQQTNEQKNNLDWIGENSRIIASNSKSATEILSNGFSFLENFLSNLNDSLNNNGSGNGTGDGSGDGTGDGSGDGTGDGSGDGTGDGTGDGSGDGTGDNSEEILQSIKDKLDEINGYSYEGPGDLEEYAVPEEYSFEERTDEFFSKMKKTSVFSLPSKLSDKIPGGGYSYINIDMGETFGGVHKIDFSYLDKGLLILRSIYLIICGTIAIRIITLKR